MDYDNRGQIALWSKKPGDSDNAPLAKGHFFAHRDIKEGEQIDVALWKNDSKSANAPKLKGKVSDKYNPGSPIHDEPAPPQDDDIPFS